MDARQEVKSLKKALRALAFMNEKGDATATEVASAIGVPRPTSYRILETLASEGYVEKQPHSGIYRITSRVQRLASGFKDEEQLLEIAKPLVFELGKELGWPITLYTPGGSTMLARINTDFDCALALARFHIGFGAPLLDATSGYCYLAHCGDEERERIIGTAMLQAGLDAAEHESDDIRYLVVNHNVSHMMRLNNRNRMEIDHLIDTVRHQGFCNIEHKQFREGNVGVPICINGKPLGGLVLRYIKSVLKNTGRIQNEYVPRLQELVNELVRVYCSEKREPSNTIQRPVQTIPFRAIQQSREMAALPQ